MKKVIYPFFKLLIPLLALSLLLSGCSNKPFLTPDNTYAIVTYDAKGISYSVPINLSWNTNTAVLRQLLVEASFVLTDLRSHPSEPEGIQKASPQNNDSLGPDYKTYLQTTFPHSKTLTFMIDGINVNVEVQSIEIEVEGDNLGQVILNETWVLQGIANPNLYPAYSKLTSMLQDQAQRKVQPEGIPQGKSS